VEGRFRARRSWGAPSLNFLSILAAVPLLGEPLDVVTLGFAAAVVATVVAGKKLSQPRAPLVAAAASR